MQRIKKCVRLLFLPLRQITPSSRPFTPLRPPQRIHPSSASPTELKSVPSLRPQTPSFLRGPPPLHLSLFLMRTPTHVHVRACRPHTQLRKTCKEPNSSATAQADEIQVGNRTANSTGVGAVGEGWGWQGRGRGGRGRVGVVRRGGGGGRKEKLTSKFKTSHGLFSPKHS